MRTKAMVIVMLLLATAESGAQQLLELLHSVEPRLAQQLEEYNSTFLSKQTYFAARYRIVRADVDALRQGRDLIVTPFNDVEPIGLVFDRFDESGTFWNGHYRNAPPGVFAISIGMFAWAVNESGTAVPVTQDRGTFYSVSATLQPPHHNKYVLEPLAYTPRYSVIYEITSDTLIPYRLDLMSGDPPLSAEEQAALSAYRDYLDELPEEADKKVLSDVR